MQLRLVQLIDQKAHGSLALLGDHADAVALAQAAQEVFLCPGKLEALLFRLQDFRHVAPDHPADVNAKLLFIGSVRAHPHSSPFDPVRAAAVSGPAISRLTPGCSPIAADIPSQPVGLSRWVPPSSP